jgi:hypothetical protein
VYPAAWTHHIKEDEVSGAICCIYLTLQNEQVTHPSYPPIYKPPFPLEHPRYHALAWTPAAAAETDPRLIPQGTPGWTKARADVTGSKLPGLIGYFAGQPQTRDFTAGWLGVDVRFSLLEASPHLEFSECGYFPHPTNPVAWGDSPDGLLQDHSMTAWDLPTQMEQDITLFGPTEPIDRGTIEIKSSRSKPEFAGYYFPQALWHMICTRTLWCDVVKYCPTQCRVFRFYRNYELESTLLRLLTRAIQDPDVAQRDPEFAALRKRFDDIARTADTTGRLIPIVAPPVPALPDETDWTHPALHRIEDAFYEISRLVHEGDNVAELTATILASIKDHVELLESFTQERKGPHV